MQGYWFVSTLPTSLPLPLYTFCIAPDEDLQTLSAQSAPCYADVVVRRQSVARAASLQQRAWILRTVAVELHVADPALPGHRASILALLRALFVASKEPIQGPSDSA